MPSDARLSPCGRLVRRHDPDRYLLSLLAPDDRREALFALYAFNLQLAMVREVVSQPLIGQMRLQWWRDAIEEAAAGRPRRHEVVTPLAEAMARYDLSKDTLLRVVDGREADLDEHGPADQAAFRRYCHDTAVPLADLALACLDAGTPESSAAAGEAALAYAMIGLVRAVPFQARSRRFPLPRDGAEALAVDFGQVYEMKPDAGLNRLARQVADEAGSLLAAARSRRRSVPKAALPVLLAARLADDHLRRLARVGFDPFHPLVSRRNPRQSWGLAWAALRGRY